MVFMREIRTYSQWEPKHIWSRISNYQLPAIFFWTWKIHSNQRDGLQNEFDPIVKSGVQDCIGHISLPGPSQGLKIWWGGRSTVVGIICPLVEIGLTVRPKIGRGAPPFPLAPACKSPSFWQRQALTNIQTWKVVWKVFTKLQISLIGQGLLHRGLPLSIPLMSQ